MKKRYRKTPGWPKALKESIKSRKAAADAHALSVLPVIWKITKSGATSLHEIADGLNERRVPTALGGKWYAKTVANILARL